MDYRIYNAVVFNEDGATVLLAEIAKVHKVGTNILGWQREARQHLPSVGDPMNVRGWSGLVKEGVVHRVTEGEVRVCWWHPRARTDSTLLTVRAEWEDGLLDDAVKHFEKIGYCGIVYETFDYDEESYLKGTPAYVFQCSHRYFRPEAS